MVVSGCRIRRGVFKRVGGGIRDPIRGLTQGPGPGPGTSISGATRSASTRVAIGPADWLRVVLGCVGVVGGVGEGAGRSRAELGRDRVLLRVLHGHLGGRYSR